MRRTLASLMPAARAIVRVDQCVALLGFSCSVISTIFFTSSIRDGARLARPWRILFQSSDAAGKKAVPPPRHLLRSDVHPSGDLVVLQALGRQQHDPPR